MIVLRLGSQQFGKEFSYVDDEYDCIVVPEDAMAGGSFATMTSNEILTGAFTPSLRFITTGYVPFIRQVGLIVKVLANNFTQSGPDDIEIVTSLGINARTAPAFNDQEVDALAITVTVKL